MFRYFLHVRLPHSQTERLLLPSALDCQQLSNVSSFIDFRPNANERVKSAIQVLSASSIESSFKFQNEAYQREIVDGFNNWERASLSFYERCSQVRVEKLWDFV